MQFSTILLAFVTVLLVVSAGLISFTMYRLANPTPTDTVASFWTKNKLFVITPTVINVLAMAVLGVLFAMR